MNLNKFLKIKSYKEKKEVVKLKVYMWHGFREQAMNESTMGLKLAVKGFNGKRKTIFWKLEEKKFLLCSSRKSVDHLGYYGK